MFLFLTVCMLLLRSLLFGGPSPSQHVIDRRVCHLSMSLAVFCLCLPILFPSVSLPLSLSRSVSLYICLYLCLRLFISLLSVSLSYSLSLSLGVSLSLYLSLTICLSFRVSLPLAFSAVSFSSFVFIVCHSTDSIVYVSMESESEFLVSVYLFTLPPHLNPNGSLTRALKDDVASDGGSLSEGEG